VFYSRYYIQETLLVFFTLAALGCGWRYWRTRRLGWILAAGAAVGMMHATKETWILSAASAVAAAILTWVWTRYRDALLFIIRHLSVRAILTWGWSRFRDSRRSCPSEAREPDATFKQDEAFGPEDRQAAAANDPARRPAPGPQQDVAGLVMCNRWQAVFHLVAAVFTAALFAAAFFSMFGKNWEGPWNSVLAYANYFRRGSQQGEHSEPWYYYLQVLFAFRPAKRIFWSEGLIAILALIGGIDALIRRDTAEVSGEPRPPRPALPRLLTFYTFFLILLYSLISYKTPWCALSFLMGMILLAGVGTAAVFRILPNWPLKLCAAVVLAAGAGHLGWQASELSLNPRYLASPLNPYIYAHTPTPLPKRAFQLDRLAERAPEGHDLFIQVAVTGNYWPLPWYLRKFNDARVGYWLDGKVWRADRDRYPPPAILMLSSDIDADNPAASMAGYGGPVYESLRPGVLIAIYVRKDLWSAYLDCQAAH
jgi:predicted membrane-bound mannosyltransferase